MSTIDAAKEYAKINKSWVVLPLHSSLSLAEQEKVSKNAFILVITHGAA